MASGPLRRFTFNGHKRNGRGRRTLTDEGISAGTETGANGHETAGAAAADRKFRPDVEGLRAIAVLLVVLFHANVPGIRGGFVGVDVFFVLSGFLITGLLLKERLDRGTVSLRGFYARRVRRILPAATVVIVVSVLASYYWLGFLEGNSVADDARWAAVFLANIHFAAIGTNYFTALAPPSPLQHMWSLGVEEQFYVVWPTLVVVVGLIGKRLDLRLRLGLVLGAIAAASFAWSVLETWQNGTSAYFSPLTRAWELALGGLLAVGSQLLPKIPRKLAIVLGIAGLIGILVSGVLFNAQTLYPGAAAALPVLGTVLVVAAGGAVANSGAELFLRLGPLQWLGKRSYSLYLWHWPILIIAEERVGRALPLWKNLLCVLAAVVASMITYRLIENPVRSSRFLKRRPVVTLAVGAGLIITSLGVAQWEIHEHQGPNGLGQSSWPSPPTIQGHQALGEISPVISAVTKGKVNRVD